MTLGTPELPAGKREFDELLNADVVKYHDEVRVRVPLTQLAENVESVTLQVRSQGCLESVLCYPPSLQTVAVSLPAAAATANAAPLDGLTELLGGGALAPASGAPALPAEQAFSAEALVTDASTVLMRFTPQPGYYLYLDKFEFVVVDGSGISVASAELPEGTLKDDRSDCGTDSGSYGFYRHGGLQSGPVRTASRCGFQAPEPARCKSGPAPRNGLR